MNSQIEIPSKLYSALNELSTGNEAHFFENICTVVEICAQLQITSEYLNIFKVIESSTDHLMINADNSLLSEDFKNKRKQDLHPLYQDTKAGVKNAAEELLKNKQA